MVIGESGSGRSTFINSFCDQLIVPPSSTVNHRPLDYDPSAEDDNSLELRKSLVELEDNEGVKINLNIIDTPGFGDTLDQESSFTVIRDYLKAQFDEVLVEESRLRRNPRFKDTRVHACLYFINPTGHGLKESDIAIIRELGDLVNIIPVIAKADSLTLQELQYNKKLILEDIQYHKLPVFNFLDEYFQLDDEYYDENDEEDETVELNRFLQKTQPFAVMGSNTVIKDESTGELKRVRKYPWGVVDIFDNEVSDFLTLKNTLLITHLNDFKDYTHEVLYENYRIKTLGEEEDDPEFVNGASSRVISLSKNAGAAAANSPILNKYGSERFAKCKRI
ncbi:unnamed protein product [Ambrosiozyma monospora]|uniref:Unnamed protein product n=1 Tax=Ambrosiozyma monospora TaxID=43982 RepID=A0ACB5U1I7_AMBMO|nr:unnamed protein product [Ambrosiozyma monospora]